MGTDGADTDLLVDHIHTAEAGEMGSGRCQLWAYQPLPYREPRQALAGEF